MAHRNGRDKWQEKLEKYREDAYAYYSDCRISPDGEDIMDYVCSCIENESGVDVDDDNYKAIAKRLNINVEIN
jgi:hypothetical protein